MELKTGEYVRTKFGTICKLSYYDDENKRWISSNSDDWFPIYESEVVKHSEDIKTLIEPGDYVNGNKVYYDNIESKLFIGNDYDQEHFTNDIEIKSVVTHEHFKTVEFKLEEE